MPKHVWSKQQEAVFDAVTNPGGHLLVQARAGAAKTTTIVEAANRLPPGLPTTLIAFNRHIANELRERVPQHIKVSTLNGIGFGWIKKHYPKVEIAKDKGLDDARVVCAEWKKLNKRPPNIVSAKGHIIWDTAHLYRRLPWAVLQVMSLIKNVQPSSRKGADDLAAGLDNPVIPAAVYVDLALRAIQRGLANTDFIDFDDQIYWPRKVLAPQNKWPSAQMNVFVDEAQDLSNGHRWLATSMLTRVGTGRIFAVGDNRQGLYSWRGAGENAMSDMQRHLGATQLSLSTTYRCPVSVVDHVKSVVKGIDDFMSRPNAPEGRVDVRSMSDMLGVFGAREGDFILSRINAPLVGLAKHFMTHGKRVSVLGKDLNRSMLQLLIQSGTHTTAELTDWLNTRLSTERTRLEALGATEQYLRIRDEIGAMLSLVSMCDNLGEVKRLIEDMFADGASPDHLVLSTIHQAKGHERKRVWLLRQTIKLGKSVEEENCYYVAATRAQEELYLVDLGNNEPGITGEFHDLHIDADALQTKVFSY